MSSKEYNMGTRYPPPLRSPEPISPFHSLRAQWDILHHYLNSLPISETGTTDHRWRRTLNHNLLITALAKKRSEIELLKSEAEHANIQRPAKIDLEFPDYNLGDASVSPVGTGCGPSEGSGESKSGLMATTSSLAKLNLSEDTDGRNLAILKTNSPVARIHLPSDMDSGRDRGHANDAERTDALTPLSPTFGARQFDCFSGTVARRRSLPASHISAREPTATNASGSGFWGYGGWDASRNGKGVLSRDWERRILWEAAWVEIEGRLDGYVGRFGGMGDGKDEEEKDNEEIWRDLVGLKATADRLSERIRGAMEDIRG